MIPDQQGFDHISTMYATQVYPMMCINNGIQEKEKHISDVYVIDEEEEIDLASLSSSISNIDVGTIDYHAVYARHVFIAAVEGQISVMQDDKLVLLDDTNAYWWLVRIIKTSDVGYIPAESIETPLERLARFNKMRNSQIDYISSPCRDKTSLTNKKKKRVLIANTISIQSMIILTDAYDTHLMESFEESKGELDGPLSPSHSNVHSTVQTPTTHRLSNTELSHNLAHHFLLHQHHHQNTSKTVQSSKKGFKQLLSSRRIQKSDTSPTQPEKEYLSVLRVFAGNISVKATFNSVLVDESTTAAELLSLALERFRLSRQQGDGVEYYITVKVLDGDEITLSSQDKPLAMFHSLNTHLTTPMPSLTHIRQKVQLTRIGVHQCPLTSFGENSVIRFLLNKRIKRINEQDGKLRVKIAYYSDSSLTLSASRFSQLRHYSRIGPSIPTSPSLDRMEKLVAVPGILSISDLTSLALEKFHLQQCGLVSSSTHGMTLVRQGKEYVLHGNRTVHDVLNDTWLNPQQCNGDLLFVLRKMQSRILDEKQEILTPTPMSAPKAPPLTATEDWIHRIDRTLSSLEQCVSVTSGAYKKECNN